MSDFIDPLPPVPQHTPPVDEMPGKKKRFDGQWLRWFIQARNKINVINESLVELANFVGAGFIVRDNNGNWQSKELYGTIGCGFNGNGEELLDSEVDIEVPYDCEIVGWTMLADQVGNCTVNVYLDEFANYPPTVSDSITGGNPPELTAQDSATTDVLTDWDTDLQRGQIIKFAVSNTLDITRVVVQLSVKRT